MKIDNIFKLSPNLPSIANGEQTDVLASTDSVLLERIVSAGHQTPEGYWYEQERSEWVILLQGNATLLFDHAEGSLIDLKAGDYLYIEPFRKHRVIYTSTLPPCIWVAVHGI